MNMPTRSLFLAVVFGSLGGFAVGQEIVEFSIPTPNVFVEGLTVGPDGNIWFTEDSTSTNCFRGLCVSFAVGIAQVDPAGNITEFPRNGTSQLFSPTFVRGMTAGPDGSLWFPEASGFPLPTSPESGIGRSTTDGQFTDFALSAFRVFGITSGPDGSLWFTASNGSSAQIGRITTDGVVTTFDLPAGSLPDGITSAPDGNLWFADSGRNTITRMMTSGTMLDFPLSTASSGPTVITTGTDGALWFIEATANQIGRITTTGVISDYAIPTPNSEAYGIAAGLDGKIWFTEEVGKVGWITSAGVITEIVIPAVNSAPTYIAVAPDGNVWFVDDASDRIGRISPSAICADAHTLCLNNGRFSVRADFQTTPEGPSTQATAVPLTSDTGYFWFFDPVNIELVVKVLTGCSVNGDYWVFASGLTNVSVQINVTDTLTGARQSYSNPFSTPFQPIQDTAAFLCP